MTAANALLAIAQMAIGVAGFSAIVGAFTTRGRLSPLDRMRFIFLFTNAFLVALLAFVPILFNEIGWSGPELWTASSGVMIVAWVFVTASGIWARRDPVLQGDLRERRLLQEGPLMFVPVVSNLVLQVGNVSGVLWQPSSAVYIAGNLIWLWSTGLVFVSIMLDRPSDRQPDEAGVGQSSSGGNL